jgi:hypothetical protein
MSIVAAVTVERVRTALGANTLLIQDGGERGCDGHRFVASDRAGTGDRSDRGVAEAVGGTTPAQLRM